MKIICNRRNPSQSQLWRTNFRLYLGTDWLFLNAWYDVILINCFSHYEGEPGSEWTSFVRWFNPWSIIKSFNCSNGFPRLIMQVTAVSIMSRIEWITYWIDMSNGFVSLIACERAKVLPIQFSFGSRSFQTFYKSTSKGDWCLLFVATSIFSNACAYSINAHICIACWYAFVLRWLIVMRSFTVKLRPSYAVVAITMCPVIAKLYGVIMRSYDEYTALTSN